MPQQQGIDYMQGNSRMRNLGPKAFSEFEDPDEIANPYAFQRKLANAQLRGVEADTERREFAASPDRQRVDSMQRQYDTDIDLEKNGPGRIDVMAGLERRKANADAESYFDYPVTSKRENERGFSREKFDQQYGRSADARMFDSEMDYRGKVEGEGIKARGGVERSRVAGLPKVRGQQLNPDDNKVIPGNEGNVGAIDKMMGVRDGVGEKPFPGSQFAEFVRLNHGGDARAAEEALAANGYYIDEDQ